MIISLGQTSDLTNYRKQVIGFIKTLTLKYDPLAEQINNLVLYNNTSKKTATSSDDFDGFMPDYIDNYYYDDGSDKIISDNKSDWKYFRNLMGDYHWSDQAMIITSLDTGRQVLFCKQMLKDHNKTRTFYRIDTDYYNELCNRFPNQVDLIKNILYPVDDIQKAINSHNLEILQFDKTSRYLENNEREFLIEKLREFLEYVDSRWYMVFLNNEKYFYYTFWSMIWYILPNILYMYRVRAIRTSNVHSWHIWQHLGSNGLDDYSDILTRQQSMFLYRNIEYIVQNAGKQSTLIILVENILSSLGVGLYGRDIYEETETKKDVTRLTAEFVPIRIPGKNHKIDNSVTTETVKSLNSRLYYSDLEVHNTTSWVATIDREYGDVTINTTATKFLELKMIEDNKKYIDEFNIFVLETLIYCANENIYNPIVEFLEPVTGSLLALTVKEILVLYNYSLYKVYEEEPKDIPTKFLFNVAYKKDKPKVRDMYKVDNTFYNVNNFLDLHEFLSYSSYPIKIVTPEEFSDFVSNLFLEYMTQRFMVMSSSDYVLRKIATDIYNQIHIRGYRDLNLIKEKTYDEWFSNNTDLYDVIITKFNDFSRLERMNTYNSLTDILLNAVLPVNEIMMKFGDFALSANKYKRLKELFIQLTSYNITFLDTSFARKNIMSIDRFSSYPTKFGYTEKLLFNMNDIIYFTKFKYKTKVELDHVLGMKHRSALKERLQFNINNKAIIKQKTKSSLSYSCGLSISVNQTFRQITDIDNQMLET